MKKKLQPHIPGAGWRFVGAFYFDNFYVRSRKRSKRIYSEMGTPGPGRRTATC